MQQSPAFSGTFKYEFKMQIRRRALWVTFICVVLLLTIRGGGDIRYLLSNPDHLPLLTMTGQWARSMNFIFPIAVGVLLADRLPRDRRTKVDELLSTLPAALSVRIAGKYLGSMLATIIPVFLFYCIGTGCLVYQSHNMLAIPFALLAFAAIMLPGLVFVSAFSIACPSILWVPLYQFLFIGYWFWGNMLNPSNGIPTLSATLLTPVGGYMASGFFGDNEQLISHATALQGVASLLLLLTIAIFVLYVLWRYLLWQQAR
jgi:ABC-2 type transport system permease protein